MDYSGLVQQLFEALKISYYRSPLFNFSEFFQGELKMLNFLDTSESGNITPSELCKALSVTSARTAAALKSAEKKGFISRRISENDRRKVIVSITDKGRYYVEQKRSCLINELEFLLRHLGKSDSAELLRIIKRLTEISENRSITGDDI